MKLRNDCDQIIAQAITAVQPDAAVRRALKDKNLTGMVLLYNAAATLQKKLMAWMVPTLAAKKDRMPIMEHIMVLNMVTILQV